MPHYASISAAQSDGVVHYWIMNEQTGASVADIVGNWNGQVIGVNDTPTESEINATVVSAPAGFGRDLGSRYTTSQDQIMPIALPAPAPSLSPLPEITVRIRFFLTSQNFSQIYSWAAFHLSFADSAVRVTFYDSGFISYSIAGLSGNLTSNLFTVGQWHDFVVSAGGGTSGGGPGVKFYLDGTEFFSLGNGRTSFDIYRYDGAPIGSFIGAENKRDFNTGEFFAEEMADIVVQDFAIWDRALTATDVQSLDVSGLSEPLTPPPPTSVQFDAPATISADFLAYTSSAFGFIVNAPFSSSFEIYQDWTRALNSLLLQESYQMIITGQEDGLEDLVVPISNWQATNQSGGRRAYLQAVIPGAQQYIDEISARSNGSLVIKQGFRLPSGESQFSEILRSDFDSLRYDRSGNRFTVTVSGRKLNETPANGTRTLKGIRTISVGNGSRRVRCDIDLFLRPGMTVIADTEEFTADYINYFVTTNDKFCEVSER